MMVWHIFKKDLRLLWPIALAAGALHVVTASLQSWLGPFAEPRQLVMVADLLSLVSLLSVAVLTLAVMHQDVVPGVRQDWLIRPIKRGNLIVAKLLFIVLIVQGPPFLVTLGESLIDGFTLPASFAAAATRNLAILCYFSLPSVMIGAVTRNITESFVLAIAGLVVYLAIFLVGGVMLLGIKSSLGGTGLLWLMTQGSWYAVALIVTFIVISLQFLRRKTMLARSLIGVGGAVIFLSAFLPWKFAFALQERLAREPSSAEAIALEFDPQLGRFSPPAGAATPTRAALYLPLSVFSVPSDGLVLMDRANVRLADVNGTILYEGRTNLSVDGTGSIEDARLIVRPNAGGHESADVYQRIFIPGAILTRLSDRMVRMEIDYYLTLFRAETTHFMTTTGAHARLKGLGWCSTRIDPEGDDVELGCLDTQGVAPCFTLELEHIPSGSHNPEIDVCHPDYGPLGANFANVWPDVSRLGGDIPFFDRSGLTHYPVDGSTVAGARVIIKTYEARDHFTRHVSVPAVRLVNLTAVADTSAVVSAPTSSTGGLTSTTAGSLPISDQR